MGNVVVQLAGLCNIGCAHLTLDEPDEALRCFEEALALPSGLGHWNTERETRVGLIRSLRRLGLLDRAARECRTLLGLAAADPYGQGLAHHQYGLVLRASGDPLGAVRHWREALAVLDGGDASVLPELRSLLADAAPRPPLP
jgi:tetratricopeptide (TPR) repeat protein